MIKPVKNSNGFTLLELILAMVIVGFIMAISLGAIRLGISTQEVGQHKTETYQRLRIISEHLSQKIKSSYPVFVSTKKSTSPSNKKSTDQPQRFLAFEGKKNSIRFVTFASPIASTDNSVWAHEVRFYLGEHPKNGKKGIIMTEKDISSGNIFTETSSSPNKERYYLLAEEVSYLNFRYYILEKISQDEPGSENETSSYKGKWVDQVLFNPPIPSNNEDESDEGNASQNDSVLSLPKGVEISIGLFEPAVSGNNKKPKLVSSPPVLLLFHSGMKFTPPDQEDPLDEENNAGF